MGVRVLAVSDEVHDGLAAGMAAGMAAGRVADLILAAGLRIAGLGGCVRYTEGPNQYTERQQARRARRLRACARRGCVRDHRAVDVLPTLPRPAEWAMPWTCHIAASAAIIAWSRTWRPPRCCTVTFIRAATNRRCGWLAGPASATSRAGACSRSRPDRD